MDSILRWAGSKRKLLPSLADYWHTCEATRYVEPFAGSAALFFAIEPEQAVLNDVNRELISAYRALRRSPKKLYDAVVSIPKSEAEYYNIRSLDPTQMNVFDRSVRFLYLNRNCFNGIYRTNQQGVFNVPYGGARTGGIPQYERFKSASKLLRNADLESKDFSDLVNQYVRNGDFVYLDPPYAVSNRRIFRQYSANTFGIYDVDRLTEVLELINNRGAYFVVSYAQSPETKKVAQGWFVKRKMAQRNVAGFAEHRRKAVEVFISNFEAEI